MAKTNQKQHYLARFYLRNFAEPIFSDKLHFLDLKKKRWDERTPDGIGWCKHLCSMIEMDGNRTDSFDQFLKKHVEDPVTPVLRKLAQGDVLEQEDRSSVALFMAVTAVRSKNTMSEVMSTYVAELQEADRAELDELVQIWCEMVNRPKDSRAHSEFLKPGYFGAIWMWSKSLQRRLLGWEWHLVMTTRDRPFVTSDHPVVAQNVSDLQINVVSFPASSERAIIITSDAQFKIGGSSSEQVAGINHQTIARAE